MNRMLMTWQWDDVRFFLAAARPALSGAARGLAVGHVTVGRRITLLETKLGVTLLKRPRMTLLQRRPAFPGDRAPDPVRV
jgi:DNA-binding transcriptional LysR family regulator